MKSNRRLLLSLSLLLLFLAACGGQDKSGGQPSGMPKGPSAYPVEVLKVEPRRVEYTITAVGSVEAYEHVQVTARISGVVEKVLFTEGDRIEAGQPLAEIDLDRYKLRLEAAKANLRKSEAEVAEAESGYARRQQIRAREPGLVTDEELEAWRTRKQSTLAGREQALVALSEAELDLRDAQVTAPVAGLIETRSIQTGQYVTPGTMLATFIRREPLLLRFTVAEADAARLSVGTVAQFHTSDDPARRNATIRHIAQAANPQTRMVDVTAEVSGDLESLRAGSFAQVSIPVGAAEEAAVIPVQAVRSTENGFLAFVVEDEIAHERTLRLGLRTADGHVEVVDGIKPGEMLVIRGSEALREGVKVRLAGEGGGKGGAGL